MDTTSSLERPANKPQKTRDNPMDITERHLMDLKSRITKEFRDRETAYHSKIQAINYVLGLEGEEVRPMNALEAFNIIRELTTVYPFRLEE